MPRILNKSGYELGDITRAVWAAHEPPRLAEPMPNDQWRDVAGQSFLHEETEQLGLIFQHFAYVTPQQLRFKEQYYGYTNSFPVDGTAGTGSISSY